MFPLESAPTHWFGCVAVGAEPLNVNFVVQLYVPARNTNLLFARSRPSMFVDQSPLLIAGKAFATELPELSPAPEGEMNISVSAIHHLRV